MWSADIIPLHVFCTRNLVIYKDFKGIWKAAANGLLTKIKPP